MLGHARPIGLVRWAVIALLTAVSAIPVVSRWVNQRLEPLRHPSPRQARWAAILIAFGAAGYLITTAVLQDRDLYPKTHDDCSYLIQMRMLAQGRLWMPAHPLADFFDTFYVLTRPVYASQYFPGTALLYVPTIWLRLPTWVLPVLAAGTSVGLLYWLMTQSLDGIAGALAVLWILSLTDFRFVSILLMSQVPALLLGLVMLAALLQWQRRRRWGWLVVIGAAAGWAAVTRPVDALCFAVPVGIATLLSFRRGSVGSARFSFIKGWAAIAIIAAAASPFLALQLVFDKGVTGHFFQTPFQMYLDRDAPGTSFGFPRFDASAAPQSVLLQKHEYYRDFVTPFIKKHQPGQVLRTWAVEWVPMIFNTTLPARVLIPLVLAGITGLFSRQRWTWAATLMMFLMLYFFYPIFLEHYAVAIIPAVILLGLLGVETLACAFPAASDPIRAAGVTLILASSLTGLWEINRAIEHKALVVDDETFHSDLMRAINEQIPDATDFRKPAVILFRYHAGDRFFEEPVYNTDVAWPDDAPIIRAHDLGPQRDREIVEYYAAHKPIRWFYLFDSKSQERISLVGSTENPDEVLRKLR